MMNQKEHQSNGQKKLLVTMIGSYDVYGVSTYLTNMLKHMDLTGYDVTYFTPQRISAKERAEELRKLGIEMRAGNLKEPTGSDSIRKKLDFHIQVILKLREICREKSYDIIQVNTGSIVFQAYMLFFSRCFGIKRRISNSRSADFNQNWIVLRKMVVRNATDLLACSDVAAECLFGKKAAQKAIIVKNGIDTERFAFDASVRAKYREKLGIGETDFVIGHVGGFAAVKNHPFLVRVFQSVAREDPSAKLLLVGGGSENKIRDLIKSFGLEERVIFAGQTNNTENYYCAMDVFAMPSLSEGLPNAGIEAQTSGLPCFFSDRITKAVKLTVNAQFLSIEDENLWAEKIMSVKRETPQRETAWMAVRDAGWDVTECAKALDKLYSSSNL